MDALNARINVACEQSDIFSIWEQEDVFPTINRSKDSDTDEFSAKLGPTFSAQNQTERLLGTDSGYFRVKKQIESRCPTCIESRLESVAKGESRRSGRYLTNKSL